MQFSPKVQVLLRASSRKVGLGLKALASRPSSASAGIWNASTGRDKSSPSAPSAGDNSTQFANKAPNTEEPDNWFPKLDGVSWFDLLRLLPQHFMWTTVLDGIEKGHPGVWERNEFYGGVEMAVRTVFEALAEQRPSVLIDVVDCDVLGDLSRSSFGSTREDSVATSEGWSIPPSMQKVTLIGLLSAKAESARNPEDRSFSVTALVMTQEHYTYKGACTKQRRLQTWTLRRTVKKDDSWKIVAVSGQQWFLPRAIE